MKRRSILSLALLVALTTANAQQTTKSEMISAARRTLVKQFGDNGNMYGNLKVADNLDELAVVTAKDGGTAYVNRQTGKVMGSSKSAYTSADALPCGLKMWIGAANHAIKSNSLGWTRADEDSSSYDITEKVGSFVKTRWSQGDPYNMLCPADKEGNTCFTGCVATAMAQVLNYYQYPAQGTGTGSYTVDGETYAAEISGTYDWDNMKTKYMSGYTDKEAKAVATLMRDCGYSVNMTYAADGSAAYDIDIPGALAYNFGYDSLAVNWIYRNITSDEEWYSTIYSELADKHPVIFSGSSDSLGGHCFVLDGVETDGRVHVNWGWAGQQDGFYDMDVFKDGYDFINSQSIVYGFTASPTPEGTTPKHHTCFLVYEPTLEADSTNLIFTAGVYNYDWRMFTGSVSLRITDTQNTENVYDIWLIAPEDSDRNLPGVYGWGFDHEIINEDLAQEGESAIVFPASTYEMKLVYKSDYDEDWKLGSTYGNPEWTQKFTVDDNGAITLDTTTGISSVIATSPATLDTSKAYDLNGNRVGNSFKGLKIVKGRKYLER